MPEASTQPADRFEAALAADDLPAARVALAAMQADARADDPELAYARARLTWAEAGSEAAEALLVRVI